MTGTEVLDSYVNNAVHAIFTSYTREELSTWDEAKWCEQLRRAMALVHYVGSLNRRVAQPSASTL